MPLLLLKWCVALPLTSSVKHPLAQMTGFLNRLTILYQGLKNLVQTQFPTLSIGRCQENQGTHDVPHTNGCQAVWRWFNVKIIPATRVLEGRAGHTPSLHTPLSSVGHVSLPWRTKNVLSGNYAILSKMNIVSNTDMKIHIYLLSHVKSCVWGCL